jgi:peptidoglycan/LPS O-acetylase OafA/YrhL
VLQTTSVVDDRFLTSEGRFLTSGDEAGTAPGDRAFRPDVEGLRAVAVLLVVLYHAGVPRLTGGFVGVDVFFVISGFVITGLLLRERHQTGGTSVLGFYARRARRILPAATLVILVAVACSYLMLGVISGNIVADDGRWAAAFLSNIHFEAQGTSYLTSSLPPSPLQNYWSLSVEEQFYVVYPTMFLLVARMTRVLTLRTRLAIALGMVIIASFGLSVTQTASHPLSAYFSPFTRAWELALGALVAVSTPWLRRIPVRIATALTWSGLAAIVSSAFLFNAQSAYPGSLVALPVVGAAAIIAGGTVIARWGAESVLGRSPFQWLGKRSYSLYLWHWPILIIAAERVHKTSLSWRENLGLVVVALVISAASYALIENPIRHWKVPALRSVAAGLALVVSTVLVLSLAISNETGASSWLHVVPAADQQVVLDQVAQAPHIQVVPKSVRRWDYGSTYDEGGSYGAATCKVGLGQSKQSICVYGDPKGSHLMVLYGDSKALMWVPPFVSIAAREHWRLVVLAKFGCPSTLVTIRGVPAWNEGRTSDPVCDRWHRWATNWINTNKPNMLVVSQADFYANPAPPGAPSVPFTAAQWGRGLDGLFHSFTVPHMKTVMLGSTPILRRFLFTGSPLCLSQHADDVQHCSDAADAAVPQLEPTDRSAALANHVTYIDTVPWFCSSICTAIIGKYEVYDTSGVHVSGPWARYLQYVLAGALGFSTPAATH